MARMFHMLGVALCCLVGACPVFVAGTEREISSPYIDKPGTLTPIFHSISSVHVRIVQQLLPVPFRSIPFHSVPGFIPSLSIEVGKKLPTVPYISYALQKYLYVCIYCSLTKECPWAELLTSLPKKGEGAVLSVSTFILTTKDRPCHIYSDLMTSKKILGQNNLQRNHQWLQSQFLTAPCHCEHVVALSAHCLFMQSCCVVTFGEVLHKVSCFRYV